MNSFLELGYMINIINLKTKYFSNVLFLYKNVSNFEGEILTAK
jgi:hypothetical protein